MGKHVRNLGNETIRSEYRGYWIDVKHDSFEILHDGGLAAAGIRTDTPYADAKQMIDGWIGGDIVVEDLMPLKPSYWMKCCGCGQSFADIVAARDHEDDERVCGRTPAYNIVAHDADYPDPFDRYLPIDTKG